MSQDLFIVRHMTEDGRGPFFTVVEACSPEDALGLVLEYDPTRVPTGVTRGLDRLGIAMRKVTRVVPAPTYKIGDFERADR